MIADHPPIKILFFLLVTACGTKFIGDNSVELAPVIVEEDFDRDTEKVTWKQWRCCKNVCGNKEPRSALKEFDSPYIVCECTNGKVFRLTRLPRTKKK